MVGVGVHIGEYISTHYVRLTGTFRMLIQKSTEMDTPLLSIAFFFFCNKRRLPYQAGKKKQ